MAAEPKQRGTSQQHVAVDHEAAVQSREEPGM